MSDDGQRQLDTRAIELAATAAEAAKLAAEATRAHDLRDDVVHAQFIAKLDKQDDAADRRKDQQDAAREALRAELVSYLAKMSSRQWQFAGAIISFLALVLASVLLKDKLF